MQKELGLFTYVPGVTTFDTRTMDSWVTELIGIVVPNSNMGAQTFTITDTTSGLAGENNQRYESFYAPDGKVYCFPRSTTMSTYNAYVLDAETGSTLETIPFAERQGTPLYVPQLNSVLFIGGGEVKFYNLSTRTVEYTLNDDPGILTNAVYQEGNLFYMTFDNESVVSVFKFNINARSVTKVQTPNLSRPGNLIVGRYKKLWGIAKDTNDDYQAFVYDPELETLNIVAPVDSSTNKARTARGLLFLDATPGNGLVRVANSSGEFSNQYWSPYTNEPAKGYLSEGSVVYSYGVWDAGNSVYNYRIDTVNPVSALCRSISTDDVYKFVNTPYGALMIPQNHGGGFGGFRTVKVMTSPYTPFPHHVCCSGYIYP